MQRALHVREKSSRSPVSSGEPGFGPVRRQRVRFSGKGRFQRLETGADVGFFVRCYRYKHRTVSAYDGL
nr:MAG TPA: hypothetical protein [Caudoviricetes sp.]